jgi:hypothetical protein
MRILTTFFLTLLSVVLWSQDVVVTMSNDSMMTKNMTACCDSADVKQKPWVSVEYRVYLDPAKTTRNELSAAGFSLDQQASEIAVKFGQFPKIFLYQQLGTLTNSNYTSLYGFGLKEKYQRDLIKHPAIVLAPYIELGAGYYQLTTVRNINGNSTSSSFSGNIQENKISNFSFTGDLGLNLGYSFKMFGSTVSLTANGGYQTNLPTTWKSGYSLAFREKLDLSSLYFGGRIGISLNDCCCCCSSDCK